ncbi:MAG: RagB/SusD family nutrient uptake outer membrane protein [Prevotella sp.]|nr:RagB/SusD family nutrient uptake outer membrane protein [Bacteroidales bacterium]MCM1069444.1 RagB/SusD family nutrient uptake outer membrane protein [Prevotella sp.]
MLLTLASCEKNFFETDSPSAMDVSVFKSAEMTEQAIGAIYNTFGEDKSFRNRLCGGYVALNTDIEFCNKGSGQAKESSIYTLSKGTGDLSTANGKDPWAYLNSAIERANVVIDGICEYSDTTDATFKYLLGETLTLRAFCYLELVKLWGDVPACFKSFDGKNLNDLYVQKTDRNVIYEQLRKDLKHAAELMPWSEQCPGNANNYTGRPSKALALGLLARMDLMYAGMALRPNTFTIGGTADCSVQYNIKDAAERQAIYQEAVWACAEIIKHEDYKLEDNFEDIFKKLCADEVRYNQSEYIWAIPFLDDARGQVLALSGLKISTNAPGAIINSISYGGGNQNNTKVQGMIQIVPTFLWDFEENDTRRDVTVCPFQWEYDNGSGASTDPSAFPGSSTSEKKLYQKLSDASSLYLGKYRIEWMKRSYASNEDCIDMPVIRYADILLMYAEAAIGSLEGNAPADLYGLNPQEQYNKVRERAGLQPQTLNMENLMAERAFEFCGENIRKYDLMRWNKLGQQLTRTMERIADLDAGQGEFEGRMDSIYFTYKQDNSFAQSGNAYVFDKFIGLKKGDTYPAEYDKTAGWIRKAFYEKDGQRHLDATEYYLYKEGVDVDMRHYWPIFDVNISASNGTLWNDYGY